MVNPQGLIGTGEQTGEPPTPPRGYRATACPGCGCWTFTPTGDVDARACFGCAAGLDYSDVSDAAEAIVGSSGKGRR